MMFFRNRISPELVSSVKRHEGLRLSAYKDSVGVWTIGYGRNLQSLVITPQTAEKWLIEDLKTAAKGLNSIPAAKRLSKAQKDVLTEMVFNLGLTGLLKFRKMWAAIERKDYHRASIEMLDSKWAQQVGQRAETLSKRFENV